MTLIKRWTAECDLCGVRWYARTRDSRKGARRALAEAGWTMAGNRGSDFCPDCRVLLEKVMKVDRDG